MAVNNSYYHLLCGIEFFNTTDPGKVSVKKLPEIKADRQ
jgi:hypothetical protein